MLEKKVPKNPKYQNVKSNINTGKTMKDVEIISKNIESRNSNNSS